ASTAKACARLAGGSGPSTPGAGRSTPTPAQRPTSTTTWSTATRRGWSASAAARRRSATRPGTSPSSSRSGAPKSLRSRNDRAVRRYGVSMLFSRAKTRMIDPAEALPGRDTPMPVPARHDVLGTPLQPPFPEGLERAVFGLGCFWGAERIFWQLPGVYTTSVGYAGGTTPNPTYEETCSGRTGHAEVVQVVYDPARISYAQLLKVFWENHDPTQGMR